MFMLISFFFSLFFYLTLTYFLEDLSIIANPHDWLMQIMTVEHVEQIGQDPALRAEGTALIKINPLSDLKGH